MTNEVLIAKIKAEVERLQDIYADAAQMYPTDEERFSYAACAVEFGDAVYSFLSTLESERPEPYNPVYDEAYLNEKIKKASATWKGVDVDAYMDEVRDREPDDNS